MYRRCAFLANGPSKRVRGTSVYGCINPLGLRITTCILSYCPSEVKDAASACPFFRAESVINSFDTEKEDDDGQVYT